jgi:hypothetical protein
MRKATEYLRTHPVIAVAILAGIIGVLLLLPRSEPQAVVTPAPSVSPPSPAGPAPGPQASPGGPPPAVSSSPGTAGPTGATPAPSPAPRAAAAPDAGRPDPFAPLVTQSTGGGGPSAPAPPPAPLPPPLFPGQQPGQPAAQPTPAPPPKDASTAELVGILSDSGGVAIVRLGGKTFIVSPGDVILNKIKVAAVDFAKGLVILEEEGERFELKMGGVSGAHVAATRSSDFN